MPRLARADRRRRLQIPGVGGASEAWIEARTGDWPQVVQLHPVSRLRVEVTGEVPPETSCLLVAPPQMFLQGYQVESNPGRVVFFIDRGSFAAGVLLVDPGPPHARTVAEFQSNGAEFELIELQASPISGTVEVRLHPQHPCLPYLSLAGVVLPLAATLDASQPGVARLERLGPATYSVACGRPDIEDNTNELGQVMVVAGETSVLDVTNRSLQPHRRKTR